MARRQPIAVTRLRTAILPEIRCLLRLSLAVPFFFLGNPAAAETGQGAQIAATCASCHDPGGLGQAIPPITTLDEQAIIKVMLAFRASESPSHVMHAVALSLSDEELAAVARYLAGKARAGRRP
jgi:sulfide dehydrogenase cytochrome subunit